MIRLLVCSTLLALATNTSLADDKPLDGVIPKAQGAMKIDGRLEEWSGAFVTPLNATHPDFFNRAVHAYYLWDEQALYIGIRALDANPTHLGSDRAIYDGDAVEFYLDTRQGADLGNPEYKPGTLHMHYTAITGHEIKPRYFIRDLPVFAGFKLQGHEIVAAKTPDGYTMEFKLPWANFPGFAPKPEMPLGIDVEMCSADGGKRIHRTFAYSSPTSVQTPAAFGRVKLVNHAQPMELYSYSRALMPVDAQVPGNYGWIYASACFSPTVSSTVAHVAARLLDSEKRVRKSGQNVKVSTIAEHWKIARAEIEIFDVPPGTYTLLFSGMNANGATVVERGIKVTLPP